MKRIYVLLLGIISALCLTATAAFAFQPIAKAEDEPASEPAYAEYLSETKIKVSDDLSKLIAITAVKNVEVVYELGYDLDGATMVTGETNKYYTSITTGGVKQTVADLFGEGYDGMIIWEVTYSAATGASVTPYVKIGVMVEGGLDITNPVTVTGATKTTKLTVKFGADEQEVNFGAELTVPENPTLENYTFVGWKKGADTDVYDFTAENAKTVVGGLTFTAAYKPVVTFTAPVNSLTVGEKINLTAPATLASEQLTVTAQIRLRGTDAWADVALTDGAAQYTTADLGMHEIKYVASYDGGSEEKVYNVWVRDKNVIADFELVGEDSYHGWVSTSKEGFEGTIVFGETVISGDYSMLVGADSDSWTIFEYDSNNNVNLTGYTDTIEFWATASKDMGGYCVCICSENEWLQPTVDIKAGTHKYVVTYPREFNRIDQLGFRNGYKWEATIRIDDIKAVVLFDSIPTGYTVGEETQVSFPATGVTNEFAQIRKVGDENWTDVAVADNKMDIKLTEAGNYELKVTATQNGTEYTKTYKVVGHDSNVIADFELNADGTYHGTNGIGWYSGTYAHEISNEWSADGSFSLRIYNQGNSWGGFVYETALEFENPVVAIELWVNANGDIPSGDFIAVATKTNDWIYTEHVAIAKGAYKYTLNLKSEVSSIKQLVFQTFLGTEYRIDGIKLIFKQETSGSDEPVVEPVVERPAANVIDFEIDADGSYRGQPLSIDRGDKLNGASGRTNEWSADGSYSYKTLGNSDDWAGLKYTDATNTTGYDLGADYDTIELTIKYVPDDAPRFSSNYFWVYLYGKSENGTNVTPYALKDGAKEFALIEGEQTLTLTLETPIRYMTEFSFAVGGNDVVYFDAITFSNSTAE